MLSTSEKRKLEKLVKKFSSKYFARTADDKKLTPESLINSKIIGNVFLDNVDLENLQEIHDVIHRNFSNTATLKDTIKIVDKKIPAFLQVHKDHSKFISEIEILMSITDDYEFYIQVFNINFTFKHRHVEIIELTQKKYEDVKNSILPFFANSSEETNNTQLEEYAAQVFPNKVGSFFAYTKVTSAHPLKAKEIAFERIHEVFTYIVFLGVKKWSYNNGFPSLNSNETKIEENYLYFSPNKANFSGASSNRFLINSEYKNYLKKIDKMDDNIMRPFMSEYYLMMSTQNPKIAIRHVMTCFEILLLNQKEPNKHTISERSALICCASRQDRETHYNEVSRLYSLRNESIHTGYQDCDVTKADIDKAQSLLLTTLFELAEKKLYCKSDIKEHVKAILYG